MGSIQRKKLADAVIDEIKRRCLSGELKAGQKLPNQNAFAAQLGVSRASLREALHTLTLVGAIEQRPGFGTVIRSCVSVLHANHISPPLMSDHRATLELIMFRKYIEVGVAELAVKHAARADILKLASQIEAMGQYLEEGRSDEYTDMDVAFHVTIAEASHNRFMLHQLVNIRGFLEQFMRESFSVLPGMLERSLRFHRKIFKAIKDRNAKSAKHYMSRHIEDIQDGLERYYGLTE